jgi:hypothetical protein
MQWEVLVDTAEASNEVVFERTDGSFSGIAAMDARWGKLKVDVLLVEVLFEGFSAFVVEALESWVKAGHEEGGMKSLESSQDGGTSAIFNGFGKDGIAVIVVEE